MFPCVLEWIRSTVFPISLNDFSELLGYVLSLIYMYMYPFLMHSIFSISRDLLFFVLQDFMGKSDPFLEISRQASDGSWQVVHRTEVSPTSILYLCFIQKSRHMYMMWYKELISNFTQQLTLHCFDDNSVPEYPYQFDFRVTADLKNRLVLWELVPWQFSFFFKVQSSYM